MSAQNNPDSLKYVTAWPENVKVGTDGLQAHVPCACAHRCVHMNANTCKQLTNNLLAQICLPSFLWILFLMLCISMLPNARSGAP